jgi:hypothetical protein
MPIHNFSLADAASKQETNRRVRPKQELNSSNHYLLLLLVHEQSHFRSQDSASFPTTESLNHQTIRSSLPVMQNYHITTMTTTSTMITITTTTTIMITATPQPSPIIQNNLHTIPLLDIFFCTTVTLYITYQLIRNVGCLIWLFDSLWYASFRLAHFCIGVFYDT